MGPVGRGVGWGFFMIEMRMIANCADPAQLDAFYLAVDSKVLQRAVLRNPCTPPVTFMRAATSGDWLTRAMLATLPNVPDSVLVTLAEDWDVRVRVALARREGLLPLSVHELLARDYMSAVRECIALRANRACISSSSYSPAVLGVQARPLGTPPADTGASEAPPADTGASEEDLGMTDMGLSRWEEAAQATDPDRIRVLSLSDSTLVKEACARNPCCPAAVVERLSLDALWRVRAMVATRVGLPHDIVLRLSKDSHTDVRLEIAKNHKLGLSVETLDRLVADREYAVRRACAEREDLHPEHVRLLEADQTLGVRQALAARKKASEASELASKLQVLPELERLADQALGVHQALGVRKEDDRKEDDRVVVEVWEAHKEETRKASELASEASELQVQLELERLQQEALKLSDQKLLEALARHEVYNRVAVATNEHCSHDLLLCLAKDASWNVREAVARRQSLPFDVLYLLANDPDERVRLSVAERVVLQPTLLQTLIKDQSPQVRSACARRQDRRPAGGSRPSWVRSSSTTS